jgi:hypothetical protein
MRAISAERECDHICSLPGSHGYPAWDSSGLT